MNEIDFIQHMQKLELKDDDIVVLKTSLRLSQNAIANINDGFKDVFKKLGFSNCRVIILEEGLEMGILRKEANYEENSKKNSDKN